MKAKQGAGEGLMAFPPLPSRSDSPSLPSRHLNEASSPRENNSGGGRGEGAC